MSESEFKKFWKAQIGPHVQPSEPPWPTPAPQDVGDMSATTDVTGMDYLPVPLRKSFFDICNESPLLVQAYNEAPLIQNTIDTIGNILKSFEDGLSEAICSHTENIDGFNKSFGAALDSLGEFLSKGQEKLQSISEAQTEAEVQKSLPSGLGYIPAPIDRQQEIDMRDKLMKAEEAGRVTSQDVLRYEMTGQIPDWVMSKL